MENLKRDVTVENGVMGFIDRGHTTLAKTLDYPIETDRLADVNGHVYLLVEDHPNY